MTWCARDMTVIIFQRISIIQVGLAREGTRMSCTLTLQKNLIADLAAAAMLNCDWLRSHFNQSRYRRPAAGPGRSRQSWSSSTHCEYDSRFRCSFQIRSLRPALFTILRWAGVALIIFHFKFAMGWGLSPSFYLRSHSSFSLDGWHTSDD